MALRVLRSTVGGEAIAPPSKSYTHRAIILGALTGDKCEVKRPLISEDTAATVSAVAMLGAQIEVENGLIRIECPTMSAPRKSISARNSGTTLRLISGVASLIAGKTSITGDESLQKRPMKPLLDALRDLGAKCSGTGENERPPVTIRGPMTKTSARLPGNISSQFISSLLLACPMKDTPTELEITGARKSESYVDISLYMLKRFRIEVERKSNGFKMPGNQRPVGSLFQVPGDLSSAAFLLCAGAVTGGTIKVNGLDTEMPQGDIAITEALRRYGAEVDVKKESVTSRPGERMPFEFDVGDSPDLFPILGVLAATAKGESRLSGGEHLRFKESDRISTTVTMLKSLGVDAKALDDGCVIRGNGKIRGGTIETQKDHRIMMAATVAGLTSVSGVVMEDEKSYEVSYPNFLDDIQRLGAIVQVVNQ